MGDGEGEKYTVEGGEGSSLSPGHVFDYGDFSIFVS